MTADQSNVRNRSRRTFLEENIWLTLGLLSAFLVTFEFAFVHEPQLGTSALLYSIDVAFLVAGWRRIRGTQDAGASDGATPRDGSAVRAGSVLPWLGSIPFDIVFLGVVGGPWGISVALWLRLVRLIRLGGVFAGLRRLERHWSTNSAALRIGRLLIVVSLVLHLLTCVWYLMAFTSGFPAESWLAIEGAVNQSTGDVYLLSLYWVVTTTTTVGFGDIVPNNTQEYVFALFVMIIGASLFAYVIATSASLISALNLSKVAFWNRVETVESYLRSRRVCAEVNLEVRNYYEYLWERHRGIGEHSLVGDLPPSLRVDVLSELLRDLLPNVPLFRYAPTALRNELLVSLEPLVTPPGSYVAREGEVADGIYFIAAGSAEVITSDSPEAKAHLGAGDYFGDLTLMLGERRGGSVRANEFVEAFRLKASDFERIRGSYPELREVLTKAANEKSESVAHLVLEGIVL
jgi:voltage-gated potassium channel